MNSPYRHITEAALEKYSNSQLISLNLNDIHTGSINQPKLIGMCPDEDIIEIFMV